MPFNVIAASEAAPGTGTVNIAWVADDRYTRLDANDSIKVTPGLGNYLLGVLYTAESTGARALLRQPKETDKSFLKCCLTADIDPVQGYDDLFKHPVPLNLDKLEALSVNATDEDTTIGLLVGSGAINPAPFNITDVIDGYADVTITANTWHDVAITWNQDLEQGKYSIVGMRASVFLAANPWVALARLNIPGNTNWKPGVPCTIAEADHEELQSQTYEPYTFWGNIGVTFNAPEQMPNIQVCSTAAHTDENVQLFLQKVG